MTKVSRHLLLLMVLPRVAVSLLWQLEVEIAWRLRGLQRSDITVALLHNSSTVLFDVRARTSNKRGTFMGNETFLSADQEELEAATLHISIHLSAVPAGEIQVFLKKI